MHEVKADFIGEVSGHWSVEALKLKCLRNLLKFGCFDEAESTSLSTASLIPLLENRALDPNLRFQVVNLLQESFCKGSQQNFDIGSELKIALEFDLILEGLISVGFEFTGNQVIKDVVIPHVQNRLQYLHLLPFNVPKIGLFYCLGSLKIPVRYSSVLRQETHQSEMELTNSTKINLFNFAEAIVTSKPILLVGYGGSGKSSVVRELSRATGNDKHLIVLHINDQTDSKSLIGSYVCTDIPGEFIWQNGIITKAVLNGYWLVIEDIHKVHLDVISMLSFLLQSRLLILPHRNNPIKAHHNFRLIGTVSIPSSRSSKLDEERITQFFLNPSTVSSSLRTFVHLFNIVICQELNSEEIISIASKKYTSIPPYIFSRLTHGLVTYGQQQSISSNVHDMFKLFQRFDRYFNSQVTDNHYISDKVKLQMALDIFDVICGKIRSRDKTIMEMKSLASLLGFFEHDVDFLTTSYLPILELRHLRDDNEANSEVVRSHLIAGRASITTVAQISSTMGTSIQNFALTNYSKRFIEKMAVCVQNKEPVLLVGETGCGKTTTIQELARLLGKKLLVQNLSLSSDLNDLLGGYRPVTIRQLFLPQYERFVRIFQATLSSSKNDEFLKICADCFRSQKWMKLVKAFGKACGSAIKKLKHEIKEKTDDFSVKTLQDTLDEWSDFEASTKRFELNFHRIENGMAFIYQKGLLYEAMEKGYWILLDEINLAGSETLQILSSILDFKNDKIYTDFSENTEGIQIHPEFFLFAAMNPPTDICKKELPESLRNRFTEFYVEELVHAQDLQTIVAQYLKDVPDAPISDIVKVYLACREASQTNLEDGAGQRPRYSLRSLTRSLKSCLSYFKIGLRPFRRCLYEGFLLNFQSMLNEKGRLFMGEYLRQCFYAEGKEKDLDYPPQRPGGKSSKPDDWTLLKPFWLRTGSEVPVDWSNLEVKVDNTRPNRAFIQTRAVQKHIRSITSAIAANVGAVLLQGPTSTGKTTMIQYIAAKCGFRCVRINNHEQTDIQEYIGSYVTGPDGTLIFQDGLLVQALRKGHWIILDELNLAPSDVLEALNRLLDDNRELLIPETGEIVKPAEGFFLFATQNPPGLYGGRKPLSLAFRNRFVEVNIPELPSKEIEEIISKSCCIAPKFSAMLVKVMLELQKHRQNSTLLLGKQGAITVRDLVKWANREPQSADDVLKQGFMLIAEKLRTESEKSVILDILSTVCKVKWSPDELFSLSSDLRNAFEMMKFKQLSVVGVSGFAVTESLKRTWNLVWTAFEHAEPVLLIGEAGCGKTMVVQLLAAYQSKQLKILNCHQSTETSDLIGGYRPVRGREAADSKLRVLLYELKSTLDSFSHVHPLTNLINGDTLPDIDLKELLVTLPSRLNDVPDESVRVSILRIIEELKTVRQKLAALFEWQDGPVTEAMKNGDILLIDEINLAEDAVIERINSVLEFSRELTLAEKGGTDIEKIVANPNFRIIATMNPSGDFGKRELSPALRSRFTEIWVPPLSNEIEIKAIIQEILSIPIDLNNTAIDEVKSFQNLSEFISFNMLNFIKWINRRLAEDCGSKAVITIREILAWSTFINEFNPSSGEQVFLAYLHGAYLTILDGLGLGISANRSIIKKIKQDSYDYLLDTCPIHWQEKLRASIESLAFPNTKKLEAPQLTNSEFVIGVFSTPLGSLSSKVDENYTLESNTAVSNLGRILRAMQIRRPVLIEGPPGVGKSSLISNLAMASGHKLIRINLSEHSELSDLLGSDLPISSGSIQTETESTNKFKWCDGIFLTAMKQGYWVLLDELNLAPQNVLEGLNACFDHRKEVFIPEIGQVVSCADSFRVFCTQNPMAEGGGRKGLPTSFLSRFTRVFVEALSENEMYETVLKVIENKLSSEDHPLRSCFANEEINQLLLRMIKFVSLLNTEVLNGNLGRSGSPWEFNLRDLFRWFEYITSISKDLSNEAIVDGGIKQYLLHYSIYLIFLSRMRSLEDHSKINQLFSSIFGEDLVINGPGFEEMRLLSPGRTVCVHSVRDVLSTRHFSKFMNKGKHQLIEMLNRALDLKWPLLLVGALNSGKKRVIEYLSEKNGTPLKYFSITPSLDAAELIGSFEQFTVDHKLHSILNKVESVLLSFLPWWVGQAHQPFRLPQNLLSLSSDLKELFSKLISLRERLEASERFDDLDQLKGDSHVANTFKLLTSGLHALFSNLTSFSVPSLNLDVEKCCEEIIQINLELTQIFDSEVDHFRGSFIWKNGVVVEAAIHGHWLILDNINLGNASVLDRINSILEPHGSLILTEEGLGREITPHPDFRIILAMDPSYGEISRAMRNRCLEVSFLDEKFPLPTRLASLTSSNHFMNIDLINIFFSLLTSSALAENLDIFYNFLNAISNSTLIQKTSQLERLLRTTQEFLLQLNYNVSANQFLHSLEKLCNIMSWNTISSSNQSKLFYSFVCMANERHHACSPLALSAMMLLILLGGEMHISFFKWISMIVNTSSLSATLTIGNVSRLLMNKELLSRYYDKSNTLMANFTPELLKSDLDFVESMKIYLIQYLTWVCCCQESPLLTHANILFENHPSMNKEFEIAVKTQNFYKESHRSLPRPARGKLLSVIERFRSYYLPIMSSDITFFTIQVQDLFLYSLLLPLSSQRRETLFGNHSKFDLLIKIWQWLEYFEESSISESQHSEVEKMLNLVDRLKNVYFSYTLNQIDDNLWNEIMIILEWIEELIPSLGSDKKDQLNLALIAFQNEIFSISNSKLKSHILFNNRKIGYYEISARYPLPIIPFSKVTDNVPSLDLIWKSLFFLRHLPTATKQSPLLENVTVEEISWSPNFVLSQRHPFNRKLSFLLKDFIALYSMFYVQFSNEFKQQGKMVFSTEGFTSNTLTFEDMIKLTVEMQRKFAGFYEENGIISIQDLEAILEPLSFTEKENFLVTSDEVHSRIEYELRNVTLQPSMELLYSYIYSKLSLIQGQLSIVLLIMHPVSPSAITPTIEIIVRLNLVETLKETLNLFISYSTFHPFYARELQTLVWSIEYLMQQKTQQDNAASLYSVLRKCLLGVDYLIYLLRFSKDSSLAARESYFTSTISLLLKGDNNSILHNEDEFQAKVLARNWAKEVFHRIDLFSLVANTALSESFVRYSHLHPERCPTVTVASYRRHRISLLVNFQTNLFVRKDLSLRQSQSESTALAAKLVLKLMNIFNGCQKYFTLEGRDFLAKFNSSKFLTEKLSCTIIDFITPLGNQEYLNYIEDPIIRGAFKQIIPPVVKSMFKILENPISKDHIHLHVAFGDGFLALLHLQLLIPDHFIDPIAKPYYQSKIVRSILSEKRGQTTAQLILDAFDVTNSNFFHRSLFAQIDECLLYAEMYENYLQQKIERPSPDYSAFIQLLHNSLSSGPLSIDKMITYFQTFFELILSSDALTADFLVNQYLDQSHIIISTIATTIDLFRRNFTVYEDITFPIISSLQAICSSVTTMSEFLQVAKSSHSSPASIIPERGSTDLGVVINAVIDCFFLKSPNSFENLLSTVGDLLKDIESKNITANLTNKVGINMMMGKSITVLIYIANRLIFSWKDFENEGQIYSLCLNICQLYANKYTEYEQQREISEIQNASLYEMKGFNEHEKDELELKRLSKLFPQYHLDTDATYEEEMFDLEKNPIDDGDMESSNFLKVFDERVMLNVVNIVGFLAQFHELQLSQSSNQLRRQIISDLVFLKMFGSYIQNPSFLEEKLSLLHITMQFQHLYSPPQKVSNQKIESKSTKLSLRKTSAKEGVCTQAEKDFLLICQVHTFYNLKDFEKDEDDYIDDRNPYPNNFHIDSCFEEIKLVAQPLEHIQLKISKLLISFPSNEILLKIMKQTKQLYFTYSIASPLAKILSNLQSLLQSLQEWEINAAKFVSVEDEIRELTNLIHRWRSLELTSWNYLLRSKEVDFVLNRTMKKYFFPLLKIFSMTIDDEIDRNLLPHLPGLETCSLFTPPALHEGFIKSVKSSDWVTLETFAPLWMFEDAKNSNLISEEMMKYETAVNKYMSKMLNSIDSLLRSCTVGEFPSLLHSLSIMFCLCNKQLVREKQGLDDFIHLKRRSKALKRQFLNRIHRYSIKLRVVKLTLGIWEFYFSFLPLVEKFQRLLQEPIAQKVKDEIKLGKWDALNVYAILDNSEKIHRKLAKVVLEYEEEVLQFPFFSLISKDLNKDLISDSGELIPSIIVPSDVSLFPYFKIISTKEGGEVERNIFDELKEFLDQSNFDQTLEKINRDHPSAVFDIRSPGKVLDFKRIPSLRKKMENHIRKLFRFSIFSDLESTNYDTIARNSSNSLHFGLMIHLSLESLSSEIFERLESLRQPTVTKPMKLRSVRDLLVNLQEIGLSPLKSSIPIIFRDSSFFGEEGNPQSQFQTILLQSSKLLPQLKIENFVQRVFDPMRPDVNDLANKLLEKAERYYARNLIEYTQLQTQSLSSHTTELSNKEIQHMVVLSQNLVLCSLKMRMIVESALTELETFSDQFFEFCDNLELLHQHHSNAIDEAQNQPFAQQIRFEFEQRFKIFEIVISKLIELQQVNKVAYESQHFLDDDENAQIDLNINCLSGFSIDEIQDFEIFLKQTVDSFIARSPKIQKNRNPTRFPEFLISPNPLAVNVEQSFLLSCQELSAPVITNLEKFQTMISVFMGEGSFNELRQHLLYLSSPFNDSKIITSDWNDAMSPHFDEESFGVQSDKALKACLIVIQRLNSLTKSFNELGNELSTNNQWLHGCFGEDLRINADGGGSNILQLISHLANSFMAFQLSQLSKTVADLNLIRANNSPRTVRVLKATLSSLKPFLSMIFYSYQLNVEQLLLSYKSLNKFTYINIRIFRNLLVKGICSNPVEDKEDDDTQQSSEELQKMRFEEQDGTGMGEGEGGNDVTDQIENEDQLAGLKKEKDLDDLLDNDREKSEKKDKTDKLSQEEQEKGMDMNDDFDGDMFDIEEDQREEDDDENEEEKEEPDREMGDANLDDIIDQKQWESDDDEEEMNEGKNQNENEKMERDSSGQGKQLEEMTTSNENKDKAEDDGNERKEQDLVRPLKSYYFLLEISYLLIFRRRFPMKEMK